MLTTSGIYSPLILSLSPEPVKGSMLERQIMEQYIQVITTTANKEDAEKIAASLVEKRLAACVQIVGPVHSIYRWEGKVEQAEEWQCLIKSRPDLFFDLEQAIKAIHPYEIPEIIALTITAGSTDYLHWLRDELQATQELTCDGHL